MKFIKKLYYKFKFRKNKYKYFIRIYDCETKEIIKEKHNVSYNDIVWYFDVLFIDTGLYVEREDNFL